MNYKDTVKNFKETLSYKHLVKYNIIEQVKIIFTTIFIYGKAIVIGGYKFIIREHTPKSNIENEECYYRAWVCYIVHKEIMKR